MAELLVCTRAPASSGDPRKDAQVYTRGDVISIHEDGHAWGTMERSLPNFTIVKVPKVPVAVFENLIIPDEIVLDKDLQERAQPEVKLRNWRLRKFRIKLETLFLLRADSKKWNQLLSVATKEAAYAAGLIEVVAELPSED